MADVSMVDGDGDPGQLLRRQSGALGRHAGSGAEPCVVVCAGRARLRGDAEIVRRGNGPWPRRPDGRGGRPGRPGRRRGRLSFPRGRAPGGAEMLSEEGLILCVAFAALALLALGVLELLAPSRPRHPRRVGRDPWRRAKTASAPARPVRAVAPAPARSVEEAGPRAEPPIEQVLRSEAERDFRRMTPAAPAGVWPTRVEPPPAPSGFARQIEPPPPMIAREPEPAPAPPIEVEIREAPEVETEPVAAAPDPEPDP